MKLIGLHYSPWTERARWVLDHHRVPYKYDEHLLVFGEPWLRWRLRNAEGEATVPALLDGGKAIVDSFAISSYVDGLQAEEKRLIPAPLLAEIKHFNLLAESMSDAGRSLILDRVLKSPEAQRRNLDGIVPRPLQGMMSGLARLGVRSVGKWFSSDRKRPQDNVLMLLQGCAGLRAQLKRSGGDYMMEGRFTYADILAATSLCVVKPLPKEWLSMARAVRETWTTPEAASQFEDLLEWRDRLYAKHRNPAVGS